MATTQLIIAVVPFLFLSLIILSATATIDLPELPLQTKPAEKTVDVVVQGLVYCQSCEKYGTWSLDGAKTIEKATIGVICKNHRNRISFYKAFETDEHGHFYAELKGFKMSNSFLDHPLQSCKVKLVASPLKTCNLLSNVNNGLYGAPLRYEGKRISTPNYEAIIYAAGPLAFHPDNCAPKEELGVDN